MKFQFPVSIDEMKSRFIEFVKFSMSSLGSTVVDLGLFALLVFLLRDVTPVHYIVVATILARIVSLIVNYNINAKLVFKADDKREFPFFKYITLAVFDMLASALFVTLLVNQFSWDETLTKMLVDSSLFFIGFLVQKLYIF